jgi:hypothetical protein
VLFSDYRAFGHDFTELVCVDIFKLLNISQLSLTSHIHIQILSTFTEWKQRTKTKNFTHSDLLHIFIQCKTTDLHVLTTVTIHNFAIFIKSDRKTFIFTDIKVMLTFKWVVLHPHRCSCSLKISISLQNFVYRFVRIVPYVI